MFGFFFVLYFIELSVGNGMRTSSLSNKFNHSDTVHSFNVKPIKMLSDPVAEAFGLIHRHPSGENFWYGMRTSFLSYIQILQHNSIAQGLFTG